MRVTTKKPVETEKQIQSYLLKRLVMHGWLAIRLNSGMQMVGGARNRRPFMAYQIANNGRSAGAPDVLGMKQGRVLLLEVKDAKGRLQETQKEFRELATAHGMDYRVIRSSADVDALLEAI